MGQPALLAGNIGQTPAIILFRGCGLTVCRRLYQNLETKQVIERIAISRSGAGRC